MKKNIDKKMYDTEKALLLAEYWNGLEKYNEAEVIATNFADRIEEA